MFLAIAGLVAVAIGTGIKAYGDVKEGKQQAETKELEAQRLRESQAILGEQLTAQVAGKGAIGKVAEIRQRELSYEALETARAGRAAAGAPE